MPGLQNYMEGGKQVHVEQGWADGLGTEDGHVGLVILLMFAYIQHSPNRKAF